MTPGGAAGRYFALGHTQSLSRPTPSRSAQRLDFLNAGRGEQKHATLAACSVRARGPTSSWWASSQFWVSLAIDARRRTATPDSGKRSRRSRRLEFAVARSSGAFHPVRSGRRRCRRNCPSLDASHPHTSALDRDDQPTARTSKPLGQHRSEERAYLLGACPEMGKGKRLRWNIAVFENCKAAGPSEDYSIWTQWRSLPRKSMRGRSM